MIKRARAHLAWYLLTECLRVNVHSFPWQSVCRSSLGLLPAELQTDFSDLACKEIAVQCLRDVRSGSCHERRRLCMGCSMSLRMGSARRIIRRRCGRMSSGGTGMGNCVKTGSKAVRIGIARRRLDGWGFVSVVMSLVVSMNVKNAMKRTSSM